MSEADKMFKELGYRKYKKGYLSNNMKELYGNEDDIRICFWLDKTIEVYDFYGSSRDFTMQELQAINKKVEELRMEVIRIIKIMIFLVVAFCCYKYYKTENPIYVLIETILVIIAWML